MIKGKLNNWRLFGRNTSKISGNPSEAAGIFVNFMKYSQKGRMQRMAGWISLKTYKHMPPAITWTSQEECLQANYTTLLWKSRGSLRRKISSDRWGFKMNVNGGFNARMNRWYKSRATVRSKWSWKYQKWPHDRPSSRRCESQRWAGSSVARKCPICCVPAFPNSCRWN